MRRKDQSILTMGNVTLALLEGNKTKWESIAPIAECVDNIKNAIGTMNDALLLTGTSVTTGTTRDKEIAQDNAMDMALQLSGFAQAYALRHGNNELLDQMKSISRRKMERMSDDALADYLKDAHARFVLLSTDASDYGLTTVKVAAFNTVINAYKALMDAPRHVIVTRKGANSTVPAQMKIIRDEFQALDLLMEVFADTDPSFLTDYRNSRIVIDRGGHHSSDSGTETPPPAEGGN